MADDDTYREAPLRLLAATLRALSVLLLCATFFGVAEAECPQSCISTFSTACNTLATGTYSDSDPTGGLGQGSFDLVLGKLNAHSAWTAYVYVDANDAYTITGPPAGTPVTFTARLSVTASLSSQCNFSRTLCGVAYVKAWVIDSGGSSVMWNSPDAPPSSSAAGIIDLPLTKLAGQPFTITWKLHATSGNYDVWTGAATGQATMSFLMPAGVGISSCQGFIGSVVTPTMPASWGRLKIRYR